MNTKYITILQPNGISELFLQKSIENINNQIDSFANHSDSRSKLQTEVVASLPKALLAQNRTQVREYNRETTAVAHTRHAAHTVAQAQTAPASLHNLADYTHTSVHLPAHRSPSRASDHVPPSSPPWSATRQQTPFARAQGSSCLLTAHTSWVLRTQRNARRKTSAHRFGAAGSNLRCCRMLWTCGCCWDAACLGTVVGGSSRLGVP